MKVFLLVKEILRLLRPRQWLKNLSLFAAITFWGTLFDPNQLTLVAKAFIIFCGVSSAVYILNDLVDIKSDRLHPYKKNRPLASGKVPVEIGILMMIGLFFVFLPAAYLLNSHFFTMVATYVALQVLYSFVLRNVIILDALTVAGGFVLRVYAGSIVAGISLSSWLALTMIGLSLLLAFGKRRSERTLLEALGPIKTRATLEHYPNAMLDAIISMASSMTIISYSLFAFQTSPSGALPELLSFLPQSLGAPKWMMLTIPIVIYGTARYLYCIYEKKEGESPAHVLLSDMPLLAAVVVWTFSVVAIIYGLG